MKPVKTVKGAGKSKGVTIRYDPKKGWVVSPRKIRLRRGEEAIFRITRGRAIIFIPWPQLFEDVVAEEGGDYSPPKKGRKTDRAILLTVSKGRLSKVRARGAKKGKGLTAKASAESSKAKPVTIPYAVYCEGAVDFAKGNSAPVMIIDPPETGGTPSQYDGWIPGRG